MPLGPREAPEPVQEEGLVSLQSCLVEGDAAQRRRERRVRRHALISSILIQTAALVLLLLFSVFGKTERIALAITTPIPPYSPYKSVSQEVATQHPPGHNVCRFCPPTNIPPNIVTHDSAPPGAVNDETGIESLLPGIPGSGTGLIPLGDTRRRPPEPAQENHAMAAPHVVHITHIDPAMLIRRVEPIYPPLARQIHREGRVEMHARIATDGTIQSVEIVLGDPMFYQSAKEAVIQWRYKPTILNGQPVEIDTYITVIYTLQH